MNNEKYSQARLGLLVKYLREFVGERSWFDFKSNDVSPEKFGAYLAGLSNAACLANQPFGYLVFGVDDDTHEVVGTRFNPMTKKRNGELLVWWLKRNLSREVAFDVFSATIDGKRVVLVEIEAAHGRPTVFAGNSHVRFGTTLTELRNCPDLERELYQHLSPDWSARIVQGLTVKDLDAEALSFARKQYAEKNKNASFAKEIAAWSDEEFLERAQLTIQGSLTYAALVLLGTRQTENWYAPFVARITWILFDHRDYRLDYEHYSPPFILVPDKIFGRIRNLTLRQLNSDSVFPKTMRQYDVRVFREVLHNCIAHQDYTMQSSIVVSEFPQRLQIANAGAFLPGSVENVLAHPGRPPYYPNKHLCDVMAELGMIDTIGLGIRTVFGIQRDNGFPVLSYEIEKEPRSVTVTIPGLPGGSNWVLPERQTMFNGLDEPITEPITEPINQDERLLQIIANNPGRRKRELATMSGIHLSNIKRLLEGALRDRVEYRGAKRNGGYYISDNPVNPIKAK